MAITKKTTSLIQYSIANKATPTNNPLWSLSENTGSNYLKKGEVFLGSQAENEKEVQSDSETSFFILLAIFFPSVTGLCFQMINETF